MQLTTHINTTLRKLPVWVVYVLGGLFPFWLLYLAATGAMGVEPIKELEHELGELALQATIFGLAVTPLRMILGVNLMKFRRAIGVLTFWFVSAHLLVWLVLDVQIPSQIWADIVKRPYITVGMGAFLLMLPLAVTSNNWSVRKLGAGWRKLHKLVYPAAILGGVHYVMLGKTWQVESLVYLMVILMLLLWRVWKALKRRMQRANPSEGRPHAA